MVSFLCSSTNAKFEVESSTLVAEGEPVCAVIMASIVMFLSCHVCMIAESVCMCVHVCGYVVIGYEYVYDLKS